MTTGIGANLSQNLSQFSDIEDVTKIVKLNSHQKKMKDLNEFIRNTDFDEEGALTLVMEKYVIPPASDEEESSDLLLNNAKGVLFVRQVYFHLLLLPS